MQLVVSLYREDISWIKHVPKHWDLIVYVKDKNHHMEHMSFIKKRAKVILLPNIGRESHTWFYHMMTNYHDLSDEIMFLQGNPTDHIDFYTNKGYENLKILLKLVSIQEIIDTKQYVTFDCNLGYVGLGETWNGFWQKHYKSETFYHYRLLWNMTYNHQRYPVFFNSVWGCQFAISKKLIRCFPYKFYEDVFDLHTKTGYCGLPWSLERILPNIFLGKKYLL